MALMMEIIAINIRIFTFSFIIVLLFNDYTYSALLIYGNGKS